MTAKARHRRRTRARRTSEWTHVRVEGRLVLLPGTYHRRLGQPRYRRRLEHALRQFVLATMNEDHVLEIEPR